MDHRELKYRVDSFTPILNHLGVKREQEQMMNKSIHYYAQKKGNDVVKLVSSDDKHEIHLLRETHGMYTLTKIIPVENTNAGLKWLQKEGFVNVSVVTMEHTDYPYKNGIVGLYVIDGFLHSVILDFPDGQHDTIAKEFGLDRSAIISVPYHTYLETLGRLKPFDIITS